jgi:DNA-binding MarR family transcriptional regulator
MESPETPTGFDLSRLLLKCHQLEKRLAAAAGLTVDEFHSLSQLYAHSPCCVKTLCALTGIRRTQASRLLRSLEKRGLILRSLGDEDKRTELLTLTPAGVGVARDLLHACAMSAPRLAGELPDRIVWYLSGERVADVSAFTD